MKFIRYGSMIFIRSELKKNLEAGKGRFLSQGNLKGRKGKNHKPRALVSVANALTSMSMLSQKKNVKTSCSRSPEFAQIRDFAFVTSDCFSLLRSSQLRLTSLRLAT